MRKGIKRLRDALLKESATSLADLSPIVSQSALLELSRTALNCLSESSLTRGAEMRQRLFLETLLNEIKDGIIILDENLDIRFVNEAAKALFPSDQTYSGRQLLAVCRDHQIVETVELAIEIGGKVSERVSRHLENQKSKKLREIVLLVEAEPFNTVSGDNVEGSWLLMRDITAELETEQIRRDFVANASHELRTPLSIINGYLETLESGLSELTEQQSKNILQTMHIHADRISRIVEDMLTISKLEDVDSLIKRESFDLLRPIERMIEHLNPIIEQNQAKIRIDKGDQERWPFVGDPYYWDQIFFNLIENALKQNPHPGLKIRISLRQNGGRYEISITDNGVGIPATDLPLVFKRFYRVEKHHSKKVKGTGLGLSIVKRAVEAHHGNITVESHPGRETTFTISVPSPPPSAFVSLPASSEDDDPLPELD